MKSNYDRVTEINNRKMNVLYLSTVITLLLTINGQYNLLLPNDSFEVYLNLIVAINLILIAGYFFLDQRALFIYSRAERTRMLQYLDNSFDTNFAGKKVDDYFTQDKLNPGFYKLAVNCFENVYHTSHTTREMQFKVYTKAVLVFIIFIFSAAVGDKGIIRTLIETILPFTLIHEAYRLSSFITRLETLNDNFKTFFTSIRASNFDKREPEAMRYVIEYETTLSWASMPLDSSIFVRDQDELSKGWDELKAEYQIEQSNS